jgi:tripartite ATP-independent transporter DctP family solute receptor
MVKKTSAMLFVLVITLTVIAARVPAFAASEEKYVMRVAFENNPGEPTTMAVEKWAELAAEKTGGKLELQIFPSSQLGNKKDLTEQIMMGANIITITDSCVLMDYVQDIGIFAAPYVADDFEQLGKLFSSDLFKEISATLNDKGIQVISTNWEYGIQHLLTKKPVRTPDDLKGMKIRTGTSVFLIESLEAMGATPTPMGLGDVYTALSSGVVDGLFNPLPVLYGGKFQEHAKYLCLSGHFILRTYWIGSHDFISKLPEDIRKALFETSDEAGVYMNKDLNPKAYEKASEALLADGVQVIEVDKEAFKALPALKALYDRSFSPGLYEKVREILNK